MENKNVFSGYYYSELNFGDNGKIVAGFTPVRVRQFDNEKVILDIKGFSSYVEIDTDTFRLYFKKCNYPIVEFNKKVGYYEPDLLYMVNSIKLYPTREVEIEDILEKCKIKCSIEDIYYMETGGLENDD